MFVPGLDLDSARRVLRGYKRSDRCHSLLVIRHFGYLRRLMQMKHEKSATSRHALPVGVGATFIERSA